MELIDIGLRGASGYFQPGAFLSLDEVFDIVESRGDHLNPAGERMKFYLDKVKSDEFFKARITFPIKKLRHVTTEERACRILETKSFMAGKLKMEPLKDFSYWSAEVGDVNRQEAFESVQQMVTPGRAADFEYEIKRQFATSPAFKYSESRYGNFVFSFPLSDLLEAYKVQHCRGGEPQLRVLGTEMYKQEITHIVMVHSPHIDQYNDLPLVPTLPSNSQSLPSVYWKEEDGTLSWKPESTSEALLVRISSTGNIEKKCALEKDCLWYVQSGSCTHNHFSVWNHLIIAFHLPGDQHLQIPKEHLLRNLSTCEASEDTVYLRDLDTKLPKHTADEVLTAMQHKYGGSPQ